MGRRGSMLRQTRHDTSATERNRQGRPGSAAKGRLLLALACLLATIVVSTAVADQPDLGPLGPGVPSSEDLITAIESRPPGAIEPITTDAGATNGVELQGIGRDDALAVLEGVFGNQLQAPGDIIARAATADLLAANVAVVSDGEDLESVPAEDSSSGSMDELPPPAGVGKAQLRGDTGDELAPPDPDPHAEVSQAQLLESSVPLGLPGEARAHEIVDLDLERNRSAINPAASLVDLRVPDELGDGIALPEIGVRVHVGGAAKSRTPSLLGDGTVAAYPNIATDTDFAVVATPTGFETFTQLRSADSPRVQSLPLVIPDNAELVAEDGGATIMRGSEVLVAISPPTAIDATGAPVPVELAVVDDAVEISVAPDESTRYPVLVDPLFQTYEWENLPYYQSGICSSSFETNVFNQCNNREEWGFEKIKQGGSSQDVRVDNQYWGLSQYVAQGTTGLYIATSNSLTSGDRGTILYSVPRYFTDQSQVGQPPTSYIRRMTLSKLLWQAYSSGPSPYLFAGLWDPIKPGWVSYYSHTGETGHGVSDMAWKYKFANGPESGGELTNPNTNVKIGEVSVQATETRSASNTHAYVGYASVELGDDLPPQAPVVSGQSGWVDHTAPPIAFTAIDSGLGVFAMKASPEGSGSEGPSWKASYGCIGVSGAPCPRTWSSGEAGPSLTYDPSQLPTGVNYLEVNAEDPVGNVSAGSFVQVKADHSAPEVSLAGSLTEQASLGLKRPSYTLRVDAVDGSPEAPQSGAEKTVIKVDGTVVDEYEQGCATQSCGISREWTLESQDFSTGPHTATVVAIDAVGRSSQQTLAFDLEPSPPTLELSGTLTEQEAIGASRPRYGLHVDAEAVAGTEASPDGPPSYHSTFGSSGTANGQFSHPAGIAVDASGNLWVVDENNDRVQKFNAKGEYLSSFGAPGSGDGQFGRPTDIAIDASGNLWVTDAGNKRVEKFTASGEYLMQFGSPGTGNGQLSAAETIAIDSSGDIWIGDTYNGRLQKFNAAGGFLEVISSKGSGEGQLIEPVSIDLGVNGDVWVADWGNQRVSVFSPGGEFVRQFGSPGAADGQFNRPDAIEVDAEGNVWVGDQNNDRIQQFNESGEYVGQFGSTGSGDEQFNFGWPMGIASDSKGNLWISDTGNHRVQRWEQAPTSGSTVTTRIELDNELIAADEAACVGEACPLALDWTLESESYSEGSHVLTVSAADGLGNTAEEVRNIEIERDQVSPSLPWVGGSLVNAPEGWVTQQAYTVFAVAEDAGYGVTSLALKIDGETVKEQAAECGSGGCAVGLFNSIDTADFAGGAHPAELVATDGAGNETTKAWTINVNPSGQITAVEAEDTLDAVDDTAESTILAPPEETLEPEQMALGDNPGLEQFGEDIVSTGVPNTTTMTTDLADGFRIESPEGTTLITPHVEPTAEEVDIAEDVAGVAANTRTGADSVVRPEYNGAQTFQAIRLPSSPHSFSWTVHLWEGQSLVSIDDDFAEVRYEDGHRAFLIVAEEAHDATGAAVPTSLEVEGEVLTLNVDVEGASFVYPIVAGAGWETSYEPPTIIEGPEDELEILEREEAEAESEEEVPPPPEPGLTLTEAELLIAAGRGGAGIVPAPEPAESSGGATASRVPEKVVKRFKVCARDSCGFWWVEIKNPSYHYKRNSNGVKTAYWQAGTQVHCNWWYNSAYYLVLSVSGHGCGFAGQTQVWAGQHKHLTAWGRYKITAHIWLPTGGTIDRVNNLGLQIWVWPNGFQQRVQTKWDDPIPIETL